jgi:hypothetical protein
MCARACVCWLLQHMRQTVYLVAIKKCQLFYGPHITCIHVTGAWSVGGYILCQQEKNSHGLGCGRNRESGVCMCKICAVLNLCVWLGTDSELDRKASQMCTHMYVIAFYVCVCEYAFMTAHEPICSAPEYVYICIRYALHLSMCTYVYACMRAVVTQYAIRCHKHDVHTCIHAYVHNNTYTDTKCICIRTHHTYIGPNIHTGTYLNMPYMHLIHACIQPSIWIWQE